MHLRPHHLLLVLSLVISTPAFARFEAVTCKNAFTVPQEIAEGNKVAAQVYAQMPVLPDSDPVARYIRQLGARLVASAPPSPGTREVWPFNFHVVASEEINAFALPGGSIFVNLGTIQAAGNEAQLAGVMAHEISHVVMRHSTCNLSKQQNKQVLYGLGSVLSSVLLGGGAAGSLAQAGIGLGQNLDFLHMSRDDERQADLLGVGILSDAGYDPRGLPQFFETIQAKYGAGGAQLLSDHPNPGNRTQYVNAEIATLPQRANPTVNTAAFATAHTQAVGERALPAKEVQTGAWKRSGQYASGPNGGLLTTSTPATQPATSSTVSTPPTLAPLDRRALGLDGAMTSLAVPRYTLRYPAQWQKSQEASGSISLIPPGGGGPDGIAYGALVDLAPQPGKGIADSAGLSDATTTLVKKLVAQNSGLQQTGAFTPLTVGGRLAYGVDLTGRSPLQNAGAPLPEHDWLITVARPDGDLSYLVFIAPQRDFANLKPTFSAIAASFQPR